MVQERLLSPRVVHCASDQIYWECCNTKLAELLPQGQIGDDRDLKSDGTSTIWSRARVYEKWDQVVKKYTDCNLSFESDKLVAIAGLARKICRQLGVPETDYTAGLWKSNLVHDLLWRFADSEHRYKKVLGRATSWSWASIDGMVIPLQQLEAQQSLLTMTSNILRTTVNSVKDVFGQITGGCITLQGPLFPVSRVAFRVGFQYLNLKRATGHHEIADYSIWLDGIRSYTSREDIKAYFLMLAQYKNNTSPSTTNTQLDYCGLLLQPLNLTRGQYRRIGVVVHNDVGFEDELLYKLTEDGRDMSLIDKDLYQDHDPKWGFTIEMI